MQVLKFIQYIVVILFSALLFFAAYSMHKNAGIDLSKTTRITGEIVNTAITERYSNKYSSQVFAFTLSNLNQTLGIYRPSKDYSDFADGLHNGDTVTVYYKLLRNNSIDIDVYQVEKNGKIVFDYKEYSHNHNTGSVLISILSVIVLLCGLYKVYQSKPKVSRIIS